MISPRLGWLASVSVGILALFLFARVNRSTFWIGASTVALAFLYSWRGVRLKALPVVDVVSHLLMLSSLLFLAGYYAYDDRPGAVLWAVTGVGFFSAYGQLYNQLRDYDMDRTAGLRNTALFLGQHYTQRAMYTCLVAALACLGISVLAGLWPVWLGLIPLLLGPLLFIMPSSADMRGTEAIDLSGRAQPGALLIANMIALAWFVALLWV